MDCDKVQVAIEMLLGAIGEDPHRPGLHDTPARVARMYSELLAGAAQNPHDSFTKLLVEDYDEFVLARDISFFSLCEHHLVPFWGKIHIGYMPQGRRLVGLSKLARAVEVLARRLQLQERLTATLADVVNECMAPRGVVVAVEAEHLCMSMRGIQKPGVTTVTLARRGIFITDADASQMAWRAMGLGK